MRKSWLLALAILPVAEPAPAGTRPHLCKAREAPAFSCSTGARIISLCASADLDDRTGTLIYRSGARRRMDLVFPADGLKPQDVFQGGVTGSTGGGADYVRFTRADTTYTLYSDYYRGREEDGLVIERGGMRISVLRCRTQAIDTKEGWSRIYRAKLPRSEEGFDVPGVTGR
jgi:hypothetical protein